MRGQTTLDFAIGISILLAVVIFVFAFVPGLLEPFGLTGEADTVLAGQVADRLTQETLGNPAEPFVLDRYCTVAFFGTGAAPSQCRYTGETLEERIDAGASARVNVTVRGRTAAGDTASEILCWDDSAHDVARLGGGDCDTALTAGPSPTETGGTASTITARRVVSLHDRNATLTVVVW